MRRWVGGGKVDKKQDYHMRTLNQRPYHLGREGHMPLRRFQTGIRTPRQNDYIPLMEKSILLCKLLWQCLLLTPHPSFKLAFIHFFAIPSFYHSFFPPAPCVSRFNDLLAKFSLPRVEIYKTKSVYFLPFTQFPTYLPHPRLQTRNLFRLTLTQTHQNDHSLPVQKAYTKDSVSILIKHMRSITF